MNILEMPVSPASWGDIALGGGPHVSAAATFTGARRQASNRPDIMHIDTKVKEQ